MLSSSICSGILSQCNENGIDVVMFGSIDIDVETSVCVEIIVPVEYPWSRNHDQSFEIYIQPLSMSLYSEANDHNAGGFDRWPYSAKSWTK